MPFNRPGSDLAMTNQSGDTWLYNFDWLNGDPRFDSTEAHRVVSLLIEHRPTPKNPGYWADVTGLRGSLLYTLRTVTNSTPSQAEAYSVDALQWAVNDNAITFQRAGVTARRTAQGIALSVKYTAAGKQQTVTATVGR